MELSGLIELIFTPLIISQLIFTTHIPHAHAQCDIFKSCSVLAVCNAFEKGKLYPEGLVGCQSSIQLVTTLAYAFNDRIINCDSSILLLR